MYKEKEEYKKRHEDGPIFSANWLILCVADVLCCLQLFRLWTNIISTSFRVLILCSTFINLNLKVMNSCKNIESHGNFWQSVNLVISCTMRSYIFLSFAMNAWTDWFGMLRFLWDVVQLMLSFRTWSWLKMREQRGRTGMSWTCGRRRLARLRSTRMRSQSTERNSTSWNTSRREWR